MNHQDLRERRRADPLRQGPGAFVCVDPARPRRHVLRTLPEPCGGKKVGPRINGAVEA